MIVFSRFTNFKSRHVLGLMRLACGDQDFSDEIRDLVQAASDSYGIKLLVSDYILGTPTKSSKLKSMPSLSIEVPGAVR